MTPVRRITHTDVGVSSIVIAPGASVDPDNHARQLLAPAWAAAE